MKTIAIANQKGGTNEAVHQLQEVKQLLARVLRKI
jgi:hypothetical protein